MAWVTAAASVVAMHFALASKGICWEQAHAAKKAVLVTSRAVATVQQQPAKKARRATNEAMVRSETKSPLLPTR